LLVAAAVDSSDAVKGGGFSRDFILDGMANGDVDRTGAAVKYTLDNFWGSLSYAETDEDGIGALEQTQLHVGMGFGGGLSGFVGYGMIGGDNSGDDPVALTLNVTKKFGSSGFRVYYEMVDLSDSDEVVGYEQTTHIAGARIDF
jgi:hypothetical protein